MTVWVLQSGLYSDMTVQGVYSTPQKGMDAWQPINPQSERSENHTYTWSGPNKNGLYDFDADWEDSATLYPYEVI